MTSMYFIFIVSVMVLSSVQLRKVCAQSTDDSTTAQETWVPESSSTTGFIEIGISDDHTAFQSSSFRTTEPTSTSTTTVLHKGQQCKEGDMVKVDRDPSSCSSYYVSCLKQIQDPMANGQPESLKNFSHSHLQEKYNTVKKSCDPGYLFDGIEEICLTSSTANCNGTYETVCTNRNQSLLHTDPIMSNFFIECTNGSARRQLCQPKGTIFDESTQTCIKPGSPQITSNISGNFSPIDDSDFGITLLQSLVWIVSGTEDKLSPWMKKVRVRTINGNGSQSIDGGDHLNKTLAFNGTNSSESEEDEVVIFSNDLFSTILYYGVIVLNALLILIFWLLFSYMTGRIFSICSKKEEEDDDSDFYRYFPKDNYVMTRM